MIKLAILGDPAVKHYAVADRLWELISVFTDKKITCDIVSASSEAEAVQFFEDFKKDHSLVGFRISGPWKQVLSDKVDYIDKVIDSEVINNVYKDTKGQIVGVNTDPLCAQMALENGGNLYKCKTVLVIGSKGTGEPIARHMHDNLDKETYIYDPSMDYGSTEHGIIHLASLNDVAVRKYDLIINATPLGRYYFDRHIEAFTSPLDLETLAQVSHDQTIVQETNYLPATTLLLQMARHLKLHVITGDLMLVFRAVESLRRYFNITLDDNTMQMLVDEIGAYIAERELAILEQGKV